MASIRRMTAHLVSNQISLFNNALGGRFRHAKIQIDICIKFASFFALDLTANPFSYFFREQISTSSNYKYYFFLLEAVSERDENIFLRELTYERSGSRNVGKCRIGVDRLPSLPRPRSDMFRPCPTHVTDDL